MTTKITATRENKTETIKSGLSIEQASEELKSLGKKIRNESRDTIDINYTGDFSFNAVEHKEYTVEEGAKENEDNSYTVTTTYRIEDED
jgi:hypothetical protein